MNPWVLNGIAALVGLAGWGIWGGIVAFAIAWSVSMLFGLICIWISGGVLPKSVRRKTAESFLEAHLETAIAAYPGLNDHALQNAIEDKIEEICRAATGQNYDQVMAAAQRLEKEETNPLRRYLITAIGMHLDRTWWPQSAIPPSPRPASPTDLSEGSVPLAETPPSPGKACDSSAELLKSPREERFMEPYGGVLSNSICYVYGGRLDDAAKSFVRLISSLDQIVGRRPGNDIDGWVESIKELSEGGDAFVFGTHLGKVMQLLSEAESHGKPWECTPDLLSKVFLGWVVADVESLERIAEKLLGRSLSLQQLTAVFRELSFFYDALWYKILLPNQIIKTHRLPRESSEAYRELVRQRSMELIATSEYLPEQWREWGDETFLADLRTDFEFYMHGVVPSARQEFFDKILNFTQARGKGPVFEMLAWLHMRTMEILGLVDKNRDPLIQTVLCRSQQYFTCELITKVMDNIVPVPE